MGARKIPLKVQKQKKVEFLEVANANHGIIQQSLDKIGVTRYYYELWLRTDPAFKISVDELPRKTKAYVESKLFELIGLNNPAAIFFWMKCQGGYIETQHIKQETTFTEPLRINVIAPSIEPLKIEGEEQKKLNE
jgi:hypothetical protein